MILLLACSFGDYGSFLSSIPVYMWKSCTVIYSPILFGLILLREKRHRDKHRLSSLHRNIEFRRKKGYNKKVKSDTSLVDIKWPHWCIWMRMSGHIGSINAITVWSTEYRRTRHMYFFYFRTLIQFLCFVIILFYFYSNIDWSGYICLPRLRKDYGRCRLTKTWPVFYRKWTQNILQCFLYTFECNCNSVSSMKNKKDFFTSLFFSKIWIGLNNY